MNAIAQRWTLLVPILAWGAMLLTAKGAMAVPIAVALAGAVLAAVHHAEVVAHRVGEPFGTLVLAVAVTVIEAGLVLSMMMAGGEAAASLARDTLFAAVMIILNFLVGICLLAGGARHREQVFRQSGVSAALTVLATMIVLTLVLPNYTTTVPGPYYSSSQLGFVAIVSLLLYLTFVLVQTVRHRDYFLPKGDAAGDEDQHAAPPSNGETAFSGALLVLCLGAVVLLAKKLAPVIEETIHAAGAPEALLGVIIAGVVLLPESIAALKAARADRIQTSLNLGLGSALASIGLTIPVVAVASIALGIPMALGLGTKETVLLILSLFVSTLSLSTGRTTVLQGAVHLLLFAVYLFVTVVP